MVFSSSRICMMYVNSFNVIFALFSLEVSHKCHIMKQINKSSRWCHGGWDVFYLSFLSHSCQVFVRNEPIIVQNGNHLTDQRPQNEQPYIPMVRESHRMIDRHKHCDNCDVVTTGRCHHSQCTMPHQSGSLWSTLTIILFTFLHKHP